MNGLLLALGASLAWGVADFVGPWQGRTLGALRVMLWAQVAGLSAIAIVVLARGQAPHDAAVLLAIPAAISGTLGLYAYYRGMAIGAMAVVAPIAGASAIVPVDLRDRSRATGRRRVQYAGIACALVGVVLASQEHQEGGERQGRRRRRARAPRRGRVRLLLPADARRRQGRPVLGLADLPDHLDR